MTASSSKNKKGRSSIIFRNTHPKAVNKKTKETIFSSLLITPNSSLISNRIFSALPVSEKLIGNKNFVKTNQMIGKERIEKGAAIENQSIKPMSKL